MDSDMTSYRAYLYARNCAEQLLAAHHLPRDKQFHIKYALEEAQKLADVLGYDLVKRETPKVEEAA